MDELEKRSLKFDKFSLHLHNQYDKSNIRNIFYML